MYYNLKMQYFGHANIALYLSLCCVSVYLCAYHSTIYEVQ